MDTNQAATAGLEQIAEHLTQDLRPIGRVSYAPRLAGYAIFEDGVMFAFVESDGTAFFRTSMATAARFNSLGATKHPQMPYWSIPAEAQSNIRLLRELAYEAADIAHLVVTFGPDEAATARPSRKTLPTPSSAFFMSTVARTLLAA